MAMWLHRSLRRSINESSTNPSANHLTNTEFDNLVTRCNDARTIYEKVNNHILGYDDQSQLLKLENIVKTIKSKKVGRCVEYSYLVLDALLRMGVKFQNLEMYNIPNGDHVFIVLNRKPHSDQYDCTTWEDSAVVIDAWAGDVYPASQIPKKLGAFFAIKKWIIHL